MVGLSSTTCNLPLTALLLLLYWLSPGPCTDLPQFVAGSPVAMVPLVAPLNPPITLRCLLEKLNHAGVTPAPPPPPTAAPLHAPGKTLACADALIRTLEAGGGGTKPNRAGIRRSLLLVTKLSRRVAGIGLTGLGSLRFSLGSVTRKDVYAEMIP